MKFDLLSAEKHACKSPKSTFTYDNYVPGHEIDVWSNETMTLIRKRQNKEFANSVLPITTAGAVSCFGSECIDNVMTATTAGESFVAPVT
jgi:hypothetical protein